jgi:hypothetical protein
MKTTKAVAVDTKTEHGCTMSADAVTLFQNSICGNMEYNKSIKILDLFAGACSLKEALKDYDFDIFAVDIENRPGIDLVQDIEFLTPQQIPFVPDVIWASIPCTSYYIAAIFHHRNGIIPKTEFARKSDRLAVNTLKIIDHFKCPYIIENPRGMLRKMPFMKNRPRRTVWYCQYGFNYAKPTDIWSNMHRSIFCPDGFILRPECKNDNPACNHERSPRGDKTSGLQGVKRGIYRSKVPEELIQEIFLQLQAVTI